MGANGSVASPSRISNEAVPTKPVLGRNMAGRGAVVYGDIGNFFYDRKEATLPADTTKNPPKFYQVDKEFPFANTAGITLGQNPVAYNPLLSRVVQTTGKPSEPLSFSTKRYPNASWRHEFQAWAQRFPVGPAAPGKGMFLYNNRYYPQNLPTQVTGDPITGNAVAGIGTAPRSTTPGFQVKGGRGMAKPFFNRQTRLAPAISYSSTTQLLGSSVFTEGPLGTGGTSGG